MSKIVIFGDSITRGAFDLEKGGWANRLKMFLWQKNYRNTGSYYNGVSVHYFGIGGDTTGDIMTRFDCEIQTIRGEIDKIIFAVGINDAGFEHGEKVSSKEIFKTNLKALTEKGIQKVKKENVYFVGVTNIDVEYAGDWFNEDRLMEFNVIMKKIISDYDCNFIPMYGILVKDDFCDDGLHPNAQGHQKMFERIREFLENNNIV